MGACKPSGNISKMNGRIAFFMTFLNCIIYLPCPIFGFLKFVAHLTVQRSSALHFPSYTELHCTLPYYTEQCTHLYSTALHCTALHTTQLKLTYIHLTAIHRITPHRNAQHHPVMYLPFSITISGYIEI